MKKDTILKFYSTYKLYIFPAIVTLASLFLIIFAIYPQVIKLMINQKTQGDLINKSVFLRSKVQALEKYDESDLENKLDLALAAYPTGKDFGNVIGLLQQLITQSGFSVSSISFGGGTADKSIANYAVKVTLSGPKILFSTLLSNLENSSRMMRVDNIETSSSNNSAKIEASLEVLVLYSQPPQNFGTVDSPLPEISAKDEEVVVNLAKVVSVSKPQTIQAAPKGKSNPFE